MEKEVRNLLLAYLKSHDNFGQPRLEKLAQFLLLYIQSDLDHENPDRRDFALAQFWTVLAYLQPKEAVHQLAKVYSNSLDQKTELVRMASLSDILSEPLADFPSLLIYAQSLGNWARDNEQQAQKQLKQVHSKGSVLTIADAQFPIPRELQTRKWWTRRRFLKGMGWGCLGLGASRGAWLLEQMRKDWNSSITPTQLANQAKLKPFPFEVVRVNHKGEIIERKPGKSQYFSQDLGTDTQPLEMVAIPGGTFLMGTDDAEIERLVKRFDQEYFRRERPQHQVTVPPFYLGKYQVTQAQWRAIASLPRVKIDLNRDPSSFKGDDRPVERINWHQAVEFCERLSTLLEGKWKYRLPTEAEWEYACRAGTTTPFYFGETITTDLANYDGNYVFASEPKGQYRGETTPVGQFPPNAFGLYDLHGNVWEWCLDDFHRNYEGAPSDGSPWISNDNNTTKILRGGSYIINPRVCRSAFRDSLFPRNGSSNDGLRVVCGLPRSS
ncbi:MAG TPA: formylglycine-generating enzyme family protein [Cyanothece sp. UBA12306]|nr:formylglycine-generating enzyme family protein [Cyanothece sp. UBA12306]